MKKENKIYFMVSLVFIFIAIIEGLFLVTLSKRNEFNNNKVIDDDPKEPVIVEPEVNETIPEVKEIIPEGTYIKMEVSDSFDYEKYDDYVANIIFYITSNDKVYQEWFCVMHATGYSEGYLYFTVSDDFKTLYEINDTLDYMDKEVNIFSARDNSSYPDCKKPLDESLILEYINQKEITPEYDYGVHYELNYKEDY